MGLRLRYTGGRSTKFSVLASTAGACPEVATHPRASVPVADEAPPKIARHVLACSDDQGNDQELTLVFAGRRMVLTTPGGTDVVLTSVQVERLRAALRDLLLDVDPSDHR